MKSNISTVENPQPAGFTAETPEVTSSPGRCARNRKCVIIAIAMVVLLVVAAIATLIGVKFYLDSKVEIERNRLQYGDVTIDEQSIHDKSYNNQIMLYHIQDKANDVSMDLITDGWRGIKVQKIVSGKDQFKVCTVTPLDMISRSSSTGQHISTLTLNSTDPKNNVIYNLSQWPILETTMLGYYGAQLCQGIDVYWAYPSCPTTSTQTNGGSSGNPPASQTRRKRAVCQGYQCRYSSASRCYYTTFPKDRRRYFTCDCSWQMYYYSC